MLPKLWQLSSALTIYTSLERRYNNKRDAMRQDAISLPWDFYPSLSLDYSYSIASTNIHNIGAQQMLNSNKKLEMHVQSKFKNALMKINVWKQPYRHFLQQGQILYAVLKQTNMWNSYKKN
jgi:hypothetical protein